MRHTKFFLTIMGLFFGQTLFGQQPNINWEKWNWLIGDWIGEGGGQPGQGGGTFSFKLDVDKKILVRKSHSEYPAVKDKPVVHEDLMVIYPDYTGIPNKAIYFDNEGHVIQYTVTYSEKSITLISSKIPHVPVFKLTYASLDDEAVNVKFEMSQDGEKFVTHIEGKSKKKK